MSKLPPWSKLTILAAGVALFVSLLGNGLVLLESNRRAEQGRQAHTGLCAFKLGLKQQVRASAKFLNDNPGPSPIVGISRAEIVAGLQRQASTVYALQGVIDCPAQDDLPPLSDLLEEPL